VNATRRGLLEGAARAFAENGLRRTTMQSVAAAAGVAKATLYNHFRTKDEVARELLVRELDRLTDLASALPVEEALAALSDELGAHPVLRRLADAEPEVLTGLLAVPEEQWARLTGRLAGALGVDAEAADLVARWLAGVVLHPGRSSARHRQAARLAVALGPDLQGQARERVSTILSSPGPA
jgi:AcrR family transcriptional regulator